MKRIGLAVMILTALNTYSVAQSAESKFTDEQKQAYAQKMDAYEKELKLTEDQATRVKAINTQYFEELSGIKSQGGSKLSRYKKFKRASERKDEQMKQVLNAEQYQVYIKRQQEIKKEVKARRNN